MLRRSNRRRQYVVERPKDWLSTLPCELVELIAEYLPAQDLLPLRLTCRTLHACSSRAFALGYITARPFLLFNQDSLDQLSKIAEDPDRRRYMRCITLSHLGLVNAKQDDRRRRFKLGDELNKNRELRIKKKEQAALHARLMREEAELRRGRSARAIESTIRNIRDDGSNLGLKCTPTDLTLHGDCGVDLGEAAPWGFDRLCSSLGYRYCMDKFSTDHDAFVVILETLRIAQHSPPVLELGALWHGVPIMEIDTRWLCPCINDHPFRNLQVLRLSLTFGTDRLYSLQQWTDDALKHLKRAKVFIVALASALEGADQLHTLGLTTLNNDLDQKCLSISVMPGLFSRDNDRQILPKLRVLELGGHVVSPYDLFEFLVRRKEYLRSVRLRCVTGGKSVRKAYKHHRSGLETLETDEQWVEKLQGSMPNCSFVYDGKIWQRSNWYKEPV